MKSYRLIVFLIALLVGGVASTAVAQYDDLYYNPDTDSEYYSSNNYRTSGNDNYITNEDDGYDNAEYGYDDDDYDYYYSSRIRRFHRPYYGFGYFDPVYVDMYYYDPFFTPGVTMLIYDDFYSFRSWNRWNRWNSWGWNRWDPWYGGAWGYNAWSPWNAGWGYNPWNPWGPRNSFYFGFNSFGGGFYNAGFYGGGYSNFYCPPSWGNGYTYNTVATVNNTYYGPRTSGTVRVPNTTKRELGIQQESPKDVTNQAPVGRVYDGVSRKDNPKATPEPGVERSRVTSREAETTRSRTYDTTPRSTTPAPATPRYDRSGSSRSNSGARDRSYTPPSQPRRDYTPPSSRNNSRTYERTQPSTPSPRANQRSNTPSSPRTYNRSNSGSNRSSSGYNRSSGSSRSSGSYSPSRSSGSSSRSYDSGSSSRSSSGSSRSSSSGNSSRSSSSSRRGGN